MLSRNIQNGFAKFFFAAINREDRREIAQYDVGRAIIRIFRQSVANHAITRSTYTRRVRIVCTEKDFAAGLSDQLVEHFLDRGQIGIKVEMLFLYIKYKAVFRVKEGNRAVAFIAFGDEEFTASIPVCVRAENRDFSADIMRRMQPALAQDVRGHCRGRCLTVHADDQDSTLRRHDRSQRFRAANRSRSAFARAFQNRIVRLDCR